MAKNNNNKIWDKTLSTCPDNQGNQRYCQVLDERWNATRKCMKGFISRHDKRQKCYLQTDRLHPSEKLCGDGLIFSPSARVVATFWPLSVSTCLILDVDAVIVLLTPAFTSSLKEKATLRHLKNLLSYGICFGISSAAMMEFKSTTSWNNNLIFNQRDLWSRGSSQSVCFQWNFPLTPAVCVLYVHKHRMFLFVLSGRQHRRCVDGTRQ